MQTNSQLSTIASYVIDALVKEGFTVHRYDAYSTSSVYIKLDYGVANSLRISDHKGKGHLAYRFNLLSYIDKQNSTATKGYPVHNYPFKEVDELVQAIIVHKKKKQAKCGIANYQKYIDKNKTEIEHDTPKGFWKQAKLIK